MHLFEFSARKPDASDPIAEYLDSLDNIVWMPEPYFVFREEVKSAVDALMYDKAGEVNIVFQSFMDMLVAFKHEQLDRNIPNVVTMYDFKYDLSQPKTMAEIIESLIKLRFFENFRKELDKAAGVFTKRNKNAAIWQDTNAVLQLSIKDYMPSITSTGDRVPQDDDFLGQLLSIAATSMPSLKFTTEMQRTKFGGMNVTANDLMDEYHASYTPYCKAAMLDKGTCARAQMTKSAFASRIVARPQELLAIL